MKVNMWISFGFFFLGIINSIFLEKDLRSIHLQLCAMMFIYITIKMAEKP